MASPLLRRRFVIGERVVRARLYWSGLGAANAYVNGVRVGSSVLDPGPSRYDKTAYFVSHDVTAMLSADVNVLGFELGRGKFAEPRVSVWRWHLAPWWDHPKLICLLRIEYADDVASVVSDREWEWTPGPVTADSLLAGERFDQRAEVPDWCLPHSRSGAWHPVRIASAPGGALRPRTAEPVEVTDVLAPVAHTDLRSGARVYDFGRQLAGWARVQARLPNGNQLTVSYGERVDRAGQVECHQDHVVPPIQRDVIVAGDTPLDHEPRFGYRGFRYVEIEGAQFDIGSGPAVEAQIVHTNVESRARFECSDPALNGIHRASRRSILDNLHGVFTDTPTFEKNGWTGDAHLSLETSILNFDMAKFYSQWLRSFADCQRDDGEIPPIIPAGDWGYSDSVSDVRGPVPAWDVAYAEICWAMYVYYADRRVLTEHYPRLRRYLQMLVARWPDLIVRGGLGDWMAPDTTSEMCPEGASVYSTLYLFRWARLLSSIARAIGERKDALHFARLSHRIRMAFTGQFVPERPGGDGDRAGGYRQSVDVLGIALGLVPVSERARAASRVIHDVELRGGRLNTGVLGTKHLPAVLATMGRPDLAFSVLTSREYPSYRYWFDHGETNLPESWRPDYRSRNHHYFSSVDRWFFEGVLGIKPASPGYREILLQPWAGVQLEWAHGHLDTIVGPISVEMRRDGAVRIFDVTIPDGASARFLHPCRAEGSTTAALGPGTHQLVVPDVLAVPGAESLGADEVTHD
ncbi:family 78 glycoside hydrolase catalytic domain [Ruania alkalisoli]|uniref:alpha-L-rhamnosidase n=1 Tax=Ruania alkalisoli TaxID=2779775 RepID=A0A7M1SSN5_9MICO|nr:family 78 glycoside hydrolase catalytic domain [Ruania alkalisoli]QOR70569.1 family 78 glycoside hydrolase catalytic domain [Ruania alkalisoli]